MLCKIHASMSKRFFSRFALALVTLWSAAVQAEKADRDKPMNVEADTLLYDDVRQVSVFTGRVVLTKGTILIRGGKLDVRQDPDGNQYGVVTADPGKLAFFRQKREGLDEYIEGEGQTIDYNGPANTVKFITNAQLRRFVGSKFNDEFKAEVIVYNNSTELFTLDGTPVPGNKTGTPAGRVRVMLTPKSDIATRPSGAASSVGVPLRETPTLRAAKP